MKHNLQFERIIFELNRGYHIILSDNENRCNILFSATEAINQNTKIFFWFIIKFENYYFCVSSFFNW